MGLLELLGLADEKPGDGKDNAAPVTSEAVWTAAQKQADGLLTKIDDLGFRQAASRGRDELKGIAASAKGDFDRAASDAKKLILELESRLETFRTEMARAKEERAKEIARFKSEITLPKWTEKFSSTREVKQLFVTPLEQAERIMENADNQMAYRAAVELAQEAKKIFDDYAAAEKEVEEISWDRAHLKRVLDFYKDYRPREYAACKKTFDTLEKDWKKMMPSAAAKAYADFRKEVDPDQRRSWGNFIGRCEVERIWREDFDRNAGEVGENLDKIDATIKSAYGEDGAEGYQGSARAELRALKVSAGAEQRDEASMKLLNDRLSALKTKVAAWANIKARDLAGPPDALSSPAAELAKDQAAGMTARKEYLKERDDLRTAYNKVCDDHRDVGKKKLSDDDRREFDDIKKLIDKAAEIANAKEDESDLQDLATANAIVTRCAERIRELDRGGPQIDRGKLGALQKDWVSGRQQFVKDTETLIANVKSLSGDQKGYEDAPAWVAAAVKQATDYFNAISFEQETAVLANGDADKAAARKRAREQALTKVRHAMDYFLGNPVMRMLSTNPFNMSFIGAGFYRTMRKIELEVLRGV